MPQAGRWACLILSLTRQDTPSLSERYETCQVLQNVIFVLID